MQRPGPEKVDLTLRRDRHSGIVSIISTPSLPRLETGAKARSEAALDLRVQASSRNPAPQDLWPIDLCLNLCRFGGGRRESYRTVLSLNDGRPIPSAAFRLTSSNRRYAACDRRRPEMMTWLPRH